MSLRKLKKYFPIFLSGLLLALILTPYLVDAKLNIPKPSDLLPGTGSEQPKDVVKDVMEEILKVAGIISILFIIIGGLQYVFSGANEELAETGKKTIRNAAIGVALVVLSWAIVNLISKALSS